jgi:hypothetical protein
MVREHSSWEGFLESRSLRRDLLRASSADIQISAEFTTKALQRIFPQTAALP